MKTENDFKTIEAMIKFGGSFAKNLGQAARFADLSNLHKIKVAFPEIWSQYEKMAQTISEKWLEAWQIRFFALRFAHEN